MAKKNNTSQRRPQGRQQPRQQARPQGRPQPRQRGRQPPSGFSRKTLVGLVAAAAVVLMGIVILVSQTGTQATPPAAPVASTGTTTGEGSTKGSPGAPVTVDEYSDFQCPYCARFALDTFPRIDESYVKTGKVRWVFHEFARIGEESKQAAQAAECAGEQGQFWAYHDTLFKNQRGENQGAFNSAKLRSFAQDLGLDTSAFNSCLDSGRYQSKINQDLAEGQRRGVKGTPSFFIAGKMIEGAVPYSEFQAAIDQALNRKP